MFTKRWSEKEKGVVREHFRHLATSELMRVLPDRSRSSIFCMASRMGVKKAEERLREMGRENNRWAKAQASTGLSTRTEP